MKRYIGIDVHKESSTLVVMGPTGRRIRKEIIETNGRVLKNLLRSIAGEKYLCIEEGEYSDWLYEICQPMVQEIVVVQPPKADGPKSDSRDAWTRADEHRQGTLPRVVFKAPEKYRTLREAVRAHLAMQQDLVRSKNRLKGLFRARGILQTGADLYSPELREDWIKKLHLFQRRRALLFGDELDQIVEMAKEAEIWLLQEAKRTPAVKLVATAPGIRWIRAAEIVATVLSPYRFPTNRHFWSYCGLAVVTSVTAEWRKDKTGRWVKSQMPMARGLNNNRNPLMKCVFKGAALTVIRGRDDHPLRQHYDRLLSETKPNLARLTIARRIAAVVLAMWKKQEVYDPKKQDRAKNR